MKKYKFIILILTISIGLLSFNTADKRHVGKWKSIIDGDTMTFVLQENGFATMIMNGESLGGESYFLDGEEYCLKYGVLYTKDPYYITLTIYFKNSNIRVSSSKGIFKFNENGDMKLNLNFEDGPRPIEFSEDETFTLKKVK